MVGTIAQVFKCFHKNCEWRPQQKTSDNLNKNLCLGTILSEHASESPLNQFIQLISDYL